MKIGILTQPLNANYGGVLQNYALQEILRRMGHEPLTLNRHRNRKDSPLKLLAKSFIRLTKPRYEYGYLSYKKRDLLARNINRFLTDNLNVTPRLLTENHFLEVIENEKCSAYIVGSDQCWRPIYSPNITDYYFDFCSEDDTTKIAYAASFGTAEWEYSHYLTDKVKSLIKNFDAVSVREDSAVKLCRDYLDTEATWVLDPTMLLDAEDYKKFFNHKTGTGLTSYFLEESDLSRQLENKVLETINPKRITRNNTGPFIKRFDSLKHYQAIPVETWLSNIAHAEYVITDSFHGVVFSIIFNKPFSVVLNSTRGNTRIESLLRDFNLQSSIYIPNQNFILPHYDWDRINAHLATRKEESVKWLKTALTQ